MYIAYPKIIIECKKHAVSIKPPCKVQTPCQGSLSTISPLPSNKPPLEYAPMSNFKIDNKPRGLDRGITVHH